jgi:N-acetylneuraminic acid mutarotase
MKKNDGFSLLELLIYMGLLSVIMVGITAIFTSVDSGRARNEVEATVNSNLRFAVEKIEGDIRSATSITTPSSGGGGGVGLGSWAMATTLPQPLEQLAALVKNGYLYLTGGNTVSNAHTSTVLYALINSTGSIGNWTTTTAMPLTDYAHSAVMNNGYIYVPGGNQQFSAGSAVWYVSISSTGPLNVWSSTTPLPTTKLVNGAAINNGYIYSVGGQDIFANYTSTVYYAQISSSTGGVGNWTMTTPLPQVSGSLSSVVYNGFIYSIGGYSGGATTSSVLYAPMNSTGSIGNWTMTTPLPAARSGQQIAFVHNGYIYIVGGFNGGAATSSVLYAQINGDGTLGNWTNTTALPSSLGREGVAVNNGYVYTVGGYDVSGFETSTVYYAPFSSGSGSTSALTLVNTSGTTISYCVVSSTLYRQQGGGACSASSDAITDSTVTVTSVTFTRFENTNAILGKTVVSIQADITMSYNGTGPDEQYSEEKVTTVVLQN